MEKLGAVYIYKLLNSRILIACDSVAVYVPVLHTGPAELMIALLARHAVATAVLFDGSLKNCEIAKKFALFLYKIYSFHENSRFLPLQN